MLPSKPQPQGDAREKPGPVQRHSCTDLPCVLLFFGHVGVFWYLAVQGLQQGDLQRLYLPRDFRGAFCGVSTGQADMTSYPKLAFAMNAGEVLDKLALQALCSDATRSQLTDAEQAACTTSGSLNEVNDVVSKLEQSMTDPAAALQMAGSFPTPTSVMADASKYLTPVCTSACSLSTSRKYSYSPPPDAPWASAYERLSSSLPLQQLQMNAWDEASCPYSARYCVPFPGLNFQPGPDDICLPELESSLVSSLTSGISKQLDSLAQSKLASSVLADVNNAVGSILTSLDALGVVAFVALLLGVVYMVLVRFFAKPVVWLSLLLIFLLLLAAGALAISKSLQCAEVGFLDFTEQAALTAVQNVQNVTDKPSNLLVNCQDLGGYAISNPDLRNAVRIVGYCFLGFAALWLLLVICLRNRIRLAIAVNQVAAEFTAMHPYVILLPLIQMILSLAYLAGWSIIAGLMITDVPSNFVPAQAMSKSQAIANNGTSPCATTWPAGFPYEDVSDCTENTTGQPLCWHCAAPRFVLNERFAFAFFSLLWHNALLAAMGQCIIAGAVATWFFTEKRRKALQPVFCRATFNAVIKHFGSLAFGSLILAVVQFLKWLMRFLSEQAKVRKNRVLQTIFKILACCLWCFEKCLKFLNKNAYIQVAIKGTNFCTSAQNAFFLILRNAIRFGALAMLGSFLYFIGILVISGATGLGGYYIFQAFHPQMSPIVPTILYVILGYLVGRLFLTVFGLACDTSLQCFIMAEESRMRGDFVPSALQSLMEKQDLGSEEKNGKCCC